jgi:hypothetical protein
MRRLAVLLPLAAALTFQPARAQSRPESAAFVVRLGTDTLGVERFTRTAARLEGEIVGRSPRTSLRRYVAEFSPAGGLTRFEVTTLRVGAPADAPPLARAVAVVSADSIRVEMRRGDSVTTSAIAAVAGLLPTISSVFGPYELMAVRARAADRDSVALATYGMNARATSTVVVTRLGRDSIRLAAGMSAYRARTDREGRILGLAAPGTTAQVTVERVPSVDLAAVLTAWAARDAQGQAMGTLSPRDTVRASAGGASLLVDYGRPAKRGREIFGNVVPWGTVWRTGANAATQFRTDRDLVIGGVVVPAGTYTLFTLPALSGWQLIVNRQTGQWGTAYDSAQDLIRVPLTVSALGAPVEVFTIAVEPQGAGGVLSFAWDRTRAQVPFTVR